MAEVSRIKLGFVPLNDAAALLVASQLGFFEAEGLDVELRREASWATVRDKLAAGLLDGAHILAPLTLAMTLGLGCEPTPMVAPFALNFGGAAITVAAHLAVSVGAGPGAEGLAALIARRRAEGASPLTFASVFPFSIHNYLLRDWLAGAGIDPDGDVRLTVAAPSRTAELLAGGVIEGFCAGEPWNEVAVMKGVGRVIAHAADIHADTPDKVFATTQAWAKDRPDALAALIRALARASAWSAQAANRSELARILAKDEAIGVDQTVIAASLDGIVFDGPGVNRPDPAQAAWLVGQMKRWNHLAPALDDRSIAAAVYRPDLYDAALKR